MAEAPQTEDLVDKFYDPEAEVMGNWHKTVSTFNERSTSSPNSIVSRQARRIKISSLKHAPSCIVSERASGRKGERVLLSCLDIRTISVLDSSFVKMAL